ncbi:MAG: hypothetical protein AAGI10_10735 [Pseudomonadota bacterium]
MKYLAHICAVASIGATAAPPLHAQHLEFMDSAARGSSITDIDLDCHSGYPVSIAGNSDDFDLTVWDQKPGVSRFDSASATSSGPVAVASGQGLAGSANFKVVTASIGDDGTPQVRVWGVGNGDLSQMSSLALPMLPKSPVKMELGWSASGITLASLAADGSTLDLVGFDVNFITGSVGPINRRTVAGVSDMAMDAHPDFAESVVVLKTSQGLRVREFDPAQGDLGDSLFGTAPGFALLDVEPGTRAAFDVAVSTNDGLSERDIWVNALDSDGFPVRVAASGISNISGDQMTSIASVAGADNVNSFQTMGERADGRFISVSPIDECDPTIGQAAVAAQGCFLTLSPDRIMTLEDNAYSAKISASGKLRVSSWRQTSCFEGRGIRVPGPGDPPPPPTTSTVNFALASTQTAPAAGAACAGTPVPQPVVTLRWVPAMTGPVPPGAISVRSQVQIQPANAACPAPADPRAGDTTQEPADRGCIVIDTNVNETSTSLLPSTNYVWRVRTYTPNVGGTVGALSPFSPFAPFRVGGPPEKPSFITPTPEPDDSFPTEGKTIKLGPGAVAGTTVSVRWQPPSCLPTNFAVWNTDTVETVIPCPEEEERRTGRETGGSRGGEQPSDRRTRDGDEEEDCEPQVIVDERPSTRSGTCPLGASYCQADGIYVRRNSENVLHVEQFNAFGTSYSTMEFNVEE